MRNSSLIRHRSSRLFGLAAAILSAIIVVLANSAIASAGIPPPGGGIPPIPSSATGPFDRLIPDGTSGGALALSGANAEIMSASVTQSGGAPSPAISGSSGAIDQLNPSGARSVGGVQPAFYDPCIGQIFTACFDAPLCQSTEELGTYTFPWNFNSLICPPFDQYDSWNPYRIWLHQYTNWGNGHGWAYCLNPYGYGNIPLAYIFPQNIYFSNNGANC